MCLIATNLSPNLFCPMFKCSQLQRYNAILKNCSNMSGGKGYTKMAICPQTYQCFLSPASVMWYFSNVAVSWCTDWSYTRKAFFLVTSDFSLIIPGSCYLLIVLSFAIAKYSVVFIFFKSQRLISETDQAAVVNTFWCQRCILSGIIVLLHMKFIVKHCKIKNLYTVLGNLTAII